MILNMVLGTAPIRRVAGVALGILALVMAGPTRGEIPGDEAERGAVVFAYGRFGAGQHSPGSSALDQFGAHLAELSDGRRAVLPLPALLEKLQNGAPLP